MKHAIGKNGVYNDETKELTVSIHRQWDGKSVFACDCGHPQCTGKQTQQTVITVASIEEAVQEYNTP